MQPYTLQARVVYPVDAPPIENGCVVIAGDRISYVGSVGGAEGEVLDVGDVALLPGLVNAHTHLEFSHLSQPLCEQPVPFAAWIRTAIHERRRRSFRPQRSILAGLSESLQSGVTTLGEIVTAEPCAYAEAGNLPNLRMFVEVIGFSGARADSALAATVGQIEALQRLGTRGESIHWGISPHAPYTVSPQLVENLVELACQHEVPVTMHLAESDAEIEFLARRTGPFRELLEERSMWDPEIIPLGSRPLTYLQLLAQARRALVVHGNYLAHDELAFLADHRESMWLVHCPRTHIYFAHRPLRVAALLSRGVRLALGTDSRASNPDLSMLSEIRHLVRHHADVRPEEALRLGTLAAAEALDLDQRVGSLTVGKEANLTAVPLPAGLRGSPAELLSGIMHDDERSLQTWLRGESLLSETLED